METRTAVLNVLAGLRQQPNRAQDKFNKRSHDYRDKDHSREEQRKRNKQVGKEKKIM